MSAARRAVANAGGAALGKRERQEQPCSFDVRVVNVRAQFPKRSTAADRQLHAALPVGPLTAGTAARSRSLTPSCA